MTRLTEKKLDSLPREVTTISKHELDPFKQGRRVGYYLLGKTIGEGSFAKVKEAIHIITGEKVSTIFPLRKVAVSIQFFDFQVLQLAYESEKKYATANSFNIFMQ